MLVIENVTTNAQGARLVSCNTVRARPLQVYSGDTGVRFVEDVSDSFKVTSLLSCEAWKNATKGRRSMRYEAVSTCHLDASVYRATRTRRSCAWVPPRSAAAASRGT